MRLLPFGVDGVLVELENLAAVLGAHQALTRARIPGVLELVPGARTILVRFDPTVFDPTKLEAALAGASTAADAPAGDLVELEVEYDGEDLAEVAKLTGMPVDEVIRRHTEREYVVAFTGFAPGFAYLAGGDPALNVPRRATPRTSIPAGAVGLAGEFSGVYPRQSPGGWQLIGRTSRAMWDASRTERPALLRPGDRVRFIPTRDAIVENTVTAVPPAERRESSKAIRVERVALSATVQDLGRPSQAAAGVSRSGAMDVAALKRANRLVGNPPSAAGIEFTAGLTVRAVGHLVLGLAGSVGTVTRTDLDDQVDSLATTRALDLRDGERVEITTADRGVYGYLAVVGGVVVEPVLGSASSNVLTGIGPSPLSAGDELAVGAAHDAAVEDWPELAPPLPSSHDLVELEVVLGPRDDWFAADAVELFLTQRWSVSSQSNRVGIRLVGEQSLSRISDAELPSEGMQPGAVQVPPNGQPVVFAADHPVTGGYPVIATLTPHSLELLAQVPAGAHVTFHAVS